MTGLLRATATRFARRWAVRRSRTKPTEQPLAVLRSLLHQARTTRFGKEHGFTDILAAADFYERFIQYVPLSDYDSWVAWLGDQSPLVDGTARPLTSAAWPGLIDIFCLTSGTTSGRTKFVPYSREMARINRRAALDFFSHMIRARPGLAPPESKALYMSGSTNLSRNEHGALAGDMSALTKFLAPRPLEWISLPPHAIAAMPHWQDRLSRLVDLCLEDRRIGMISGIPIWQLTLLESVAEKSGKPLGEVMPALSCIVHGGMSVAPYREQLAEVAPPDTLFLEIYAASETGIAAFQIPGEAGMRFMQHYGVFYEFEDPRGNILLSGELKPGIDYALIVSTCSGLWRYRIGDRVVFRQTEPLVLDYVTRDKTTSTFDEKVTEKQLENAMAGADPRFADFSLGPDVSNRRHVWFLVTEGELPAKVWIQHLDNLLRKQNEDYDDYRGDGRIKKPTLAKVSDRSAFLLAIGREEGGQRKFPRMLSPEETAKLLELFPPQ